MLRYIRLFLLTLFLTLFAAGAATFAAIRFTAIEPFKTARELIVTTAETTMTHQWIAKAFASDAQIRLIMAENALPEVTEAVKLSLIDTAGGSTGDSGGADSQGGGAGRPAKAYIPANDGYSLLEDGIYIKDVSGSGFAGKLMLVTDPSRVKVGAARKLGTRGDLVKQMVPMGGAVAGINGGWFVDPQFSSEGGVPTGFVIKDGAVVFGKSSGAVTIMGFNGDNAMVMGTYTPASALKAGIRDCFATIPILIVNGDGQITKGDGGWGIAPRSAVGQRADGGVLLLTIDGRQISSVGATLKQVQDVLLANGAVNAIGLDGGSSTVMYYNGAYLNKPALGHERYIPTSIIVMPN